LGTVTTTTAAKSKPTTVRTVGEDDDGGIDRVDGAVLDALSQKLQIYLGSLSTKDEKASSSLSQEEISELCCEIEQAENTPVTAAILQVWALLVLATSYRMLCSYDVCLSWFNQSAKYKPLTKLIRNSKGKNPGKDGISDVQERCGAVRYSLHCCVLGMLMYFK
jgi:hypothetical protein